jgi:hypothetical protein
VNFVVNIFTAPEIVLCFTKSKKEWNKLSGEDLGVYKTGTFLFLIKRRGLGQSAQHKFTNRLNKHYCAPLC